ncbi:MAG: TraC family protein [Rectinema sp.]|nr:TraC family protein [Rectinema sp.]
MPETTTPQNQFSSVTRLQLAENGQKNVFSVSHHLMPWSYMVDDQVFVLSDGSVMKVLECFAAATSVMSDAALRHTSEIIAKALSRLPANTIVQCTISPTVNIDDDIASYRKQGNGEHPLFSAIEAKKIEFFLETRRTPMFTWKSIGGAFSTRKFRILLCVIIVPDTSAGSLQASFTDVMTTLSERLRSFFQKNANVPVDDLTATERRFAQLREHLLEQVQNASSNVITALQGRGIAVRPLSVTDYIGAMRGLMYPQASIDAVSWDPYTPLAHQMPISDLLVDFNEGYVFADGVYHRCASLAGLPKYSYPGFLSRPQQVFNGLTVLDYLTQGHITFSGIVLSRQAVRNYLEKRRRFILGGFSVKERRPYLLADIDLMYQKIEGEGRNVLMSQLLLSTWDTDPLEARKRIEKLREKLEQIDLRFRVEIHHAASLWFQSLPGNYAPSLPESRRLHWMADDTVADFLPLYGMSRGSQRARFMAHNRMGEPVRIDLFEGAAPHGVVIGASGSGKSFFISNLVADFLRNDKTQAFFIDKGRSYETLTALCGEDGQYNVFGLKSRTCINPCAGTLAQAGAFLNAFIAYLVVQNKERDALTSDQVSLIAQAINKAFERKQSQILPYEGGFADAVAKYPGVYFHYMGKRFRIKRLDRNSIAALERAKSTESGRTPEYFVLFIARLMGKDRQSGWERAADVPEDVREWFDARQAEIEDQIPGIPGLHVLYRQESLEAAMQREMFHYEPNNQYMLLECQREEDLEVAVNAGAEVIYPEEFLSEQRDRILQSIRENPAYANATEQAIKEYVDMRMGEISAADFFRWMPGKIVTQAEVFLSDIARELLYMGDDRAASVGARLEPYVGKGVFAGFFDGRTDFKISGKRIVCWEIEELASAGQHLLGAVVGSLLQTLILYGQTEEGRQVQKIVILEEFWQLLESDMIAEQVINMYRTARKFNTGVLCISQLISDFASSKNGRRILDQANYRFILLQPANVVAETPETLRFTPEQEALLATVTSQRGLFSEIFWQRIDSNECDVMRLVPNPYFYWVATTHPLEVRARERLIKEIALEVRDRREATRLALEKLSREYPHGIENRKG